MEAAGGQWERKGKERDTYRPAPDYPCSLEEVKALVAAWVVDGEIKLPDIEHEPSRRDRESQISAFFTATRNILQAIVGL